ncbi:37522_t:CDS:2, partial [Gigaspora margarita]
MNSSISNYMLENDILDDEFSGIVWDYFNVEITEKGKITVCQICKKNNISVKYAHDSSTGNMLGHLWSKHQIDKDYSEGASTNGSIVKAMHVITKQRQEKIAQLLVEFIIEDCQPFYILQSKAFCRLLNYMKAGFQIPCESTGLTERVFCIMTDNGTNVKKAIGLMNNITQLSCSAHTLQLSVLKGLKPAMQLIKRAKNLILFFSKSPKQSDRLKRNLKELQIAIKYLALILLSESEHNLILLLKPFYEATNIFSGSSYPTYNLIYSTMRLLIKEFAPSYGETEEDYADLLFEPSRRAIEPPVTNEKLCDLVKAMSYFSLKEYWEVPEEIGLIASFLDLRIKNLKFFGNETLKARIFDTVRTLCIEEEYHQPSVGLDESFNKPTCEPVTTNGLIVALYSSEELDDETYDETEVDYYIREPIEKRGCNPLT